MFPKTYAPIFSKSSNAFRLIFLLFFSAAITQCSKTEEEPPTPTGLTKTYTVRNTNLSEITGAITFIENVNSTTTIECNLQNTIASVNNVLYLRRGTANIGGGLAAVLNAIDGLTGKSTTVISKLNDGQKITYDDLLNFSGYIAIGVSGQNTGELAAHSDIGPNEFTGNQIVYQLLSPMDGNFKGLATFEERKKGTAALKIALQEYGLNNLYPAKLRSTEEGNDTEILLEFPPVDGKFKGNSFSEFTEITSGPITYQEMLQLNATIEVYNENSASVIAIGGIGVNPQVRID